MPSTPKAIRQSSGRARPDSSLGFTLADPVAWNLSWEGRASEFTDLHEMAENWGEVDEAFLVEYRSHFEALCSFNIVFPLTPLHITH
jgi:hypothetical protein